jgi:hypothetical protein
MGQLRTANKRQKRVNLALAQRIKKPVPERTAPALSLDETSN